MRVLVVTVTAGNGHNQTAKALVESLENRGAEVQLLDLYQYISRTLYRVVDQGYLFSVRHMPRRFGKTYAVLERRGVRQRVLGLLNSNRILAGRLAGFLREFNPEVIVTTHVFGAQVLDVLKRQKHLNTPVIGIVTDFCFHPFWEAVPSVEHIVTASESMRYAAKRRGIEEERLLPLGIPIAEKFSRSVAKEEARVRLGLAADLRTILIMGGSMGYGNLCDYVSQIDQMDGAFQIVCITGSNKKVYEEIEQMKVKKPLHLQGFTDCVDLYMDAADCIVTKPGGLTVSESLAKGLPMVLVSPIPGQEERNTGFLLNSGAAVLVDRHVSITQALDFVFGQAERIEIMKAAIRLIARPHATAEISNFVESLVEKGQ